MGKTSRTIPRVSKFSLSSMVTGLQKLDSIFALVERPHSFRFPSFVPAYVIRPAAAPRAIALHHGLPAKIRFQDVDTRITSTIGSSRKPGRPHSPSSASQDAVLHGSACTPLPGELRAHSAYTRGKGGADAPTRKRETTSGFARGKGAG